MDIPLRQEINDDISKCYLDNYFNNLNHECENPMLTYYYAKQGQIICSDKLNWGENINSQVYDGSLTAVDNTVGSLTDCTVWTSFCNWGGGSLYNDNYSTYSTNNYFIDDALSGIKDRYDYITQ